ncbi:unnamed protein product [Brachionus calyciflorus]|uniref:Uncharacterized protein n=1 Tax=Brachionus calyciflorus TaxID=104777 RepID=A0A814S468_9BILA|nr:unnamed protein product [Brachionus calyciflorus]
MNLRKKSENSTSFEEDELSNENFETCSSSGSSKNENDSITGSGSTTQINTIKSLSNNDDTEAELEDNTELDSDNDVNDQIQVSNENIEEHKEEGLEFSKCVLVYQILVITHREKI